MAFIDTVIAQAQQDPKTVLLPEPEDDRTLHAAAAIQEKGIARVVLIGNEGTVAARTKELGIAEDFEVVDPGEAGHFDDFCATFHEMRKKKGLTEEAAAELMRQPIPHGVMMLHKGMGNALVAGAIHSTGDTLRPALQILRTAPGVSLVSSFFFMTVADTTYLFADCGLVENPDAEQLAQIALATAQSAINFGIEPTVAMLSYSTKGSASSPLVDKVVEATRIAQEKAAEVFGADSPVRIDGELQLDAAVVEKVAASKAPGSPVGGKARVLVFPDLNAGNIGYKLTQRLGGASAYGPVIQGMRMPVNDLSRGCSADDIVGVAAVSVVQSQRLSQAG
jgi:phosphate acetyltransferase